MASEKMTGLVKDMGEIYGRTVSLTAAAMFLEDLKRFPEDQLIKAFARCRQELRTFPTVADVIARMDDGRPGIEEAWSLLPFDERDSAVWTEEMSSAFNQVRGLLDNGDPIAARMAFKEIYPRLVSEARAIGAPARWSPTLGHDPHGRQKVLQEAVQKGRLTLYQAQNLDPMLAAPNPGKSSKVLAMNPSKLLRDMPK